MRLLFNGRVDGAFKGEIVGEGGIAHGRAESRRRRRRDLGLSWKGMEGMKNRELRDRPMTESATQNGEGKSRRVGCGAGEESAMSRSARSRARIGARKRADLPWSKVTIRR